MDWRTADPWSFVDHVDFLACDDALFEDRISHVLACIDGRDEMDEIDLKWTILLLIQWSADKWRHRHPCLRAWESARDARLARGVAAVIPHHIDAPGGGVP